MHASQKSVFGFCVTFWYRSEERTFVIAEAAESLASAIGNARHPYQSQELLEITVIVLTSDLFQTVLPEPGL